MMISLRGSHPLFAVSGSRKAQNLHPDMSWNKAVDPEVRSHAEVQGHDQTRRRGRKIDVVRHPFAYFLARPPHPLSMGHSRNSQLCLPKAFLEKFPLDLSNVLSVPLLLDTPVHAQ